MLGDAALLGRIEGGESDRVEFTASTTGLDKFREAICAAANDLPGNGEPGLLFIGLLDEVGRDNFGRGATSYRNPTIAEAMKNMGFMQRFGIGIETARTTLAENGNPPPEFDVQDARPVFPTGIEKRRTDPQGLAQRLAEARAGEAG